jgi:cytochrome c oxidase assembly factor CtaG
VPPLSALARRYLVAESVQFSVLAMICPALIALGAPWRRLPRTAGRLAATRDGRPSFLRGMVFLIVFAGVSLAWRIPPALDALARIPGLAAAEAMTLLVAGTGLWLGLVPPPPGPRFCGAQRAAIAALAMWSTWVAAYALGFSGQPLVHAYAGDSGLGVVADQEIAVALVWAVAGACFVPVIFAAVFSWLKDGDIGEEFRQAFPEAGAGPGVRGWQRPPRRRGARSGGTRQ